MATDDPITAREQAERDEELRCRFYEQEYPEVDECVMVLVRNIADMGAYVSLVEYNNIEGMILLSELSRRRIRSINKLIRVGKMEVCMVMRVDKEKGYIDLSRRRVTREDAVKAEERYSKGKAVHSIMRNVAETTGSVLENLNKEIAWPLAQITAETGSAARPFKTNFEAFTAAITDPDLIFNQPGVTISDSVKSALIKVIKRKLTPQPIKIRADVEVTCFSEQGIEAIREALRKGEAASPEDNQIKIKLIAPPLYVFMSTSLDKSKGLAAMENAINVVKESLSAHSGGRIEVKKAPRVTSQQDDSALQSLLERAELDNTEVAGDDE